MYFLEHFGDPHTNPRRWPRLALGTLGVVDRAGESRADGERLLIAADGINLVTRLEPVSRVVDEPFSGSEHAHVIASNGRADLHYLHHAIELSELKPYLTSVTRPKLNRAALERIAVPVPPLALQHAFRALVEKARALKALQRKSGERLDELYAALRLHALWPGRNT
jgi:type I restriction enzyme S subunit